LAVYDRPEVIGMFEKLGVLNKSELHGRVEVEYEKFIMKIQIEARVLGDLAINHIVPTAIEYQTTLLKNVKNMKEVFSAEEFDQLASSRLDRSEERRVGKECRNRSWPER